MFAAPAASASTDIAQCGNAAITTSGATLVGTYGTWSWAGGAGLGSWATPAVGTSVFTPSTPAGTFTATLSATGNGACVGRNASSTRVITWQLVPTAVTVSVLGGSPACGSANLTASGGTGGTVYWQNAAINGTDASTAGSTQAVSASGTYYFRSQSAAGCWGTQGSAAVTVNPVNNAAISYAASPACKSAGGSLAITRTGTTGGIYTATGVSLNSSTGAVDVAATASGTYIVTYSMAASGVCPANTSTAQLSIGNSLGTLSAPAGPTSICQGTGSSSFTASANNATSYAWAITGTGNAVAGTTGTGITTWANTYTGPATISITAYGCGGTSATTTQSVNVWQTGTWLGNTTSWITPGNWCGSLPVLTSDVFIPPGVVFMPRADGGAIVRNITILPGASVTVLTGNSLTVHGAFANQGTFTLQPNSSMAFSGLAAQAIPPMDYANLSTSGGAKTFSGTVRISGTFSPGAATHNVAGSTIEFTSGSAQSIPAFTYDNLAITGSSTKTLTGNVTVGSTLSLSSGILGLGSSILRLNGTVAGTGQLATGCLAELQVAGAGNTGTLNFVSGQNTLGKLGLLKTTAGTVNLGTDLNICALLTLTQGKIVLGASNLTLLTGASTTNGSQTSYVQTADQVEPNGAGFFIQELPINAGGRTYPVGTSTYSPAYLANVGSTGNFKVRVFNDIFEFGIAGSLVQNILTSVRKTWEIAPITVGGAPNVAMTLEWNDADEGTAFAAARTNTNLPYIGKNIGVGSSVWVPQLVSAKNLATPPYTITTPSITTFSKFAVGSSMNPLPVSMGTLHVVVDAKTNKLLWETYSEINAKGFKILRSRNGIDFTEIGYVQASGNSNQRLKYRYVDKAPLPGLVYYKIQFEGTDPKDVAMSNVVSVSPSNVLEFKVYPNPANDRLNVELSADEALDVDLRMIDVQGRMFHLPILEGEAGTYRLDISHLAPGIYLLEKVVSGAVLSKARLVKQ